MQPNAAASTLGSTQPSWRTKGSSPSSTILNRPSTTTATFAASADTVVAPKRISARPSLSMSMRTGALSAWPDPGALIVPPAPVQTGRTAPSAVHRWAIRSPVPSPSTSPCVASVPVQPASSASPNAEPAGPVGAVGTIGAAPEAVRAEVRVTRPADGQHQPGHTGATATAATAFRRVLNCIPQAPTHASEAVLSRGASR